MRFAVAEVRGGQAGSDAIAFRLAEIIFIQVVRLYVDRAGEAAGALAGILDPRLGRALAAIHDRPEQDWTVARMAREAGLSRTLFADRFAKHGMAPVGMSPLAPAIGRRRLSETDLADPHCELGRATGRRPSGAHSRLFR
jgi:transcriptional regulator GlxA family with amidase domain